MAGRFRMSYNMSLRERLLALLREPTYQPANEADLARRLYDFRIQGADALRDGPLFLRQWLRTEYHLDHACAAILADFFRSAETRRCPSA